MTKPLLSSLLAAAMGLTVMAMPVMATTMPKVDIQGGHHTFGIGLGGPSLSLDFGITNQFSLGVSASTSFLYRYWGNTSSWFIPRMDIRGVYQFLEGGNRGLSAGVILGVVGDPSKSFGSGDWGPELGVGLTYPFTSTILGRLNLVGGWGGRFFVAPASGAELAFKLTPAVELAVAANGNGDILGLRCGF